MDELTVSYYSTEAKNVSDKYMSSFFPFRQINKFL
jgi:hypothetical protein